MVLRRRFYAGPAMTQNVVRATGLTKSIGMKFYSGIRLVPSLLSFVSAAHCQRRAFASKVIRGDGSRQLYKQRERIGSSWETREFVGGRGIVVAFRNRWLAMHGGGEKEHRSTKSL